MPVALRDEASLPDKACVVRGGMMMARDLAMASERCQAALGFPGISVFAAPTTSLRSVLLVAPQLRVYTVVRRTTARALRKFGAELLPTGASPHFTLRLPDVEFATLARLRDLFGPPIPNPLAR